MSEMLSDGQSPSEAWVELRNGSLLKLASRSRRLIARLLDLGVFYIAVSTIFLVTPFGEDELGLLPALLLFGWPVYEVALTTIRGQTVGKQIMSIKVVSVTHGLFPTWGRSCARWVSFGVLSYLPLVGLLNFMSLLWTKNRQTWHDKIGGTVVVTASDGRVSSEGDANKRGYA